MAQSPSEVEGRAFDVGWRIVKRRLATYPTCADVNCMAQVENHGDYCIRHKPTNNPLMKGKFQGYSKNNISGRAERQSKRRAWGQSRKNKSKRTANRYKRSKVRGSGSGARPKMRRQLGAGGKRVARDR